jgi:lipoprotein-releasing system permease protein
MQRKREIAVLQALGATPGKIMGIFAWQGVIIGTAGALCGVILALLVLYYRLEIQTVLAGMGMDPFPMQAHGITLPAVYDPATFAGQAFKAFVMVTIAAIIPAIIVSRQDPAKALRSN